jgi:hypothetical protein
MVTATAMFLLVAAAISFNSMAAYAQGGGNMTGANMTGMKSTTIHDKFSYGMIKFPE